MSMAVELQECDECVEPAEAFALIGEEICLGILEAHWRLEAPARVGLGRAEIAGHHVFACLLGWVGLLFEDTNG